MEKLTERLSCHDCGVKEGQIHILGCDMERCPFCGNQLLCCVHGMGCLDDAQAADLERVLRDKGRIPFIAYPNHCAKCGTLWPEMFNVPDEEWAHYIEPAMRQEMLCEPCYTQIKSWIDGEGLEQITPARR